MKSKGFKMAFNKHLRIAIGIRPKAQEKSPKMGIKVIGICTNGIK